MVYKMFVSLNHMVYRLYDVYMDSLGVSFQGMVSFEPLDVQDRECVLRVPGTSRTKLFGSSLRLGRCDTANGHVMCSEKVEELLPRAFIETPRDSSRLVDSHQDPSDPVAGVKLFQAQQKHRKTSKNIARDGLLRCR